MMKWRRPAILETDCSSQMLQQAPSFFVDSGNWDDRMIVKVYLWILHQETHCLASVRCVRLGEFLERVQAGSLKDDKYGKTKQLRKWCC